MHTFDWCLTRYSRFAYLAVGLLLSEKFTMFVIFFSGVKRETTEDLDFGNFNLFEDPKKTFATFNFNFDRTKFERLTKLMEFNVKNNINVILDTIKRVIQRKRRSIEGSQTASPEGLRWVQPNVWNQNTSTISSEGGSTRSEKSIEGNETRSTVSTISSEGTRSVQTNGWYRNTPEVSLEGARSVQPITMNTTASKVSSVWTSGQYTTVIHIT